MSNTIQFDYDIFYNYYTNDDHLKINKTKQEIQYYTKTFSKEPVIKTVSNNYILIDNDRVYVTKLVEKDKDIEKKELLFSIPNKENALDKSDNHFHFGIDINGEIYDKNLKQTITMPIIFFHKTIQHPEKGGKEMINCYFHPKMEMNMNTFEDMKCLQRGYKMRELYTKQDFIYIKEIINRPFLKSLENNKKKTFLEALTGKGGTKKKTRRNRRKSVRRNRRR